MLRALQVPGVVRNVDIGDLKLRRGRVAAEGIHPVEQKLRPAAVDRGSARKIRNARQFRRGCRSGVRWPNSRVGPSEAHAELGKCSWIESPVGAQHRVVRFGGGGSEAVVVRGFDESRDRAGAEDFQIGVRVPRKEAELLVEIVVTARVELVRAIGVGDGVEKDSWNRQRGDGAGYGKVPVGEDAHRDGVEAAGGNQAVGEGVVRRWVHRYNAQRARDRHVVEVAALQIGGGHRARVSRALTLAFTFVVREEERLIFADRPAKVAAELIEAQLRLPAVDGRGPALGVELVVAEEFPRSATNIVAAALDGDVHNTARTASVLSGVAVRLHLELRYGVHRGPHHIHPFAAEAGGVGVVVHTIEQIVVLQRAIAVDVDRAADTLRGFTAVPGASRTSCV